MTVFGRTHYIPEFNPEVTEEERHTHYSLTHSQQSFWSAGEVWEEADTQTWKLGPKAGNSP